MTGSVYIPGLKRYFMIGWYYPTGGGVRTKDSTRKTAWDFYEAPALGPLDADRVDRV